MLSDSDWEVVKIAGVVAFMLSICIATFCSLVSPKHEDVLANRPVPAYKVTIVK